MSHINFICEIAHAYQHMPAYFHYITQNHAYLPTHTRTWVPMMAQWPPLMRGHPFWEATFTQHLGWLLVRGFTVYWSRQPRVFQCLTSLLLYFWLHDRPEFCFLWCQLSTLLGVQAFWGCNWSQLTYRWFLWVTTVSGENHGQLPELILASCLSYD